MPRQRCGFHLSFQEQEQQNADSNHFLSNLRNTHQKARSLAQTLDLRQRSSETLHPCLSHALHPLCKSCLATLRHKTIKTVRQTWQRPSMPESQSLGTKCAAHGSLLLEHLVTFLLHLRIHSEQMPRARLHLAAAASVPPLSLKRPNYQAWRPGKTYASSFNTVSDHSMAKPRALADFRFPPAQTACTEDGSTVPVLLPAATQRWTSP